MRAVKILGLIVAAILLVLGASIAGVAIGGDRAVAAILQRYGSSVLGRHIRFGGTFHIQWGQPTRIVAEDVHVANAGWGTAPEMFAARRVEIVVEPWPLLQRKLVVHRLMLDRAKLLLETSAKGAKNWNFFGAKAATPKKRTGFPELREFVARDSTFTWHNGTTGATTDISFNDLMLKAPNDSQPVRIAAKGVFQKKPYRFVATVGPIREMRNPTRPYPVKLDGEIASSTVEIAGTIDQPLDFDGVKLNMSLAGPDPQPFLAVFSVPMPKLPHYRLAGRLTHSGNHWQIDDLEGRVGNSRIAGGIGVDVRGEGKVPYAKADLVASYLDLADFKGLYGGNPGGKAPPRPPSPSGRIIPNARLALGQLPGIDADLSLDAPNVKPTAGLPFRRFDLVVSLKEGTLHLHPLRFAVAGGDVTVNIAWASQTKPPRFEADLDVRQLDLHKLFAGASKALSETVGIVGGSAKLRSAGATQREVLAGADGEVTLFMSGGRFSQGLVQLFGVDLLKALGLLIAGGKELQPVECFVARFDVAKGVATANTLLLATPDKIGVGTGNINLGDETLYLDFMPHARSFSPLALPTPIEVRGTFADPDIRLGVGAVGARIGAAIGLGLLAPPAALLPLISTGLGPANECGTAFATLRRSAPPAAAGSSQPPKP